MPYTNLSGKPKDGVVLPLAATVAQLAEQLICNQRVGGSIPFGGSKGVK